MFILVFGEVFPKTLASRHPESIALHVAKPIRTVIFILSPLVWILTESINFLIIRFGGKERVQHPFVTEDKIKMMLRVGEKEGTIEKHRKGDNP